MSATEEFNIIEFYRLFYLKIQLFSGKIVLLRFNSIVVFMYEVAAKNLYEKFIYLSLNVTYTTGGTSIIQIIFPIN